MNILPQTGSSCNCQHGSDIGYKQNKNIVILCVQHIINNYDIIIKYYIEIMY
jgi:hypothetical protein